MLQTNTNGNLANSTFTSSKAGQLGCIKLSFRYLLLCCFLTACLSPHLQLTGEQSSKVMLHPGRSMLLLVRCGLHSFETVCDVLLSGRPP